MTGTVERTLRKVGCITLIYNASRLVNFDVIRNMILGGPREEPTVVNLHTEKNIKRKGNGDVERYG